MVGQGEGLGALQMGVAGNEGVQVAVGLVEQGLLEAPQAGIESIDRLAQPEAQIGADLIVAAAAGMEASRSCCSRVMSKPIEALKRSMAGWSPSSKRSLHRAGWEACAAIEAEPCREASAWHPTLASDPGGRTQPGREGSTTSSRTFSTTIEASSFS
jgi:hypothetical protein